MGKEWYFVRKLRLHERSNKPGWFEIQLLDDSGRAVSVGYVGEDTKELEISGRNVPLAVIEAARNRDEGEGDYVGPDGQRLPPF